MRMFNRLLGFPGTFAPRSIWNFLLTLCLGLNLPIFHSDAKADAILEYQVKAAFIYNFIAFTHWPGATDRPIHLCVYGEDHFGNEIDKLQSKSVGMRHIKIARINDPDQLKGCQAIFFSKSVSHNLSGILDSLPDEPILALADTPNVTSKGVAINMNLMNEKIVFEINLAVARKSGLDINSKLLQLAVKVHQ